MDAVKIPTMLRVMLVDDEEFYRCLVRTNLDREDDFQVVTEASDGTEAVELADEVNPDLIIMDVLMPYMDGFEATRLILERNPEARVVLVSRTGRQQEYSRMSKDVGALAFIAKQDLDASILRQVLHG